MQEPNREEDAALDASREAKPVARSEEFTVEPKAYAFDGWGMVPLELDAV